MEVGRRLGKIVVKLSASNGIKKQTGEIMSSSVISVHNSTRILCVALLAGCAAIVSVSAQTTKRPAAAKPASKAPDAKPALSPAPGDAGRLKVSGNIRARLESWNWFDTDKAKDSYNFGAVTLRATVAQNKPHFDWLAEGEVPLLINLPARSIAPAPQGQLGLGANYFAANGKRNGSLVLKQGFGRFKSLFGNAPSSLKIGRFEFNDGAEITPTDATLAALKRERIAQRLIGTFGFSHIGRSFDGVQYVHQTKAANFTFVAARPTTGVFDLDANKEMDIDFWYGAFSKPVKRKSGASEYRFFALHYHDGRRILKTDNRTAARRTADTDNIRITTVGVHYLGTFKTGRGKAEALLWGVGQFGRWGNLDHRAAAIAIESGYQPGGKTAAKIKPWIRAGYFRSTGDGDPSDKRHGTFFQVLPTPRVYARTPFFNLMNLEDSFAELLLKPHARLALRTDVHYLRLSSVEDLWYSGGGAFQKQTFGYTGRPSNGKKTLGTMLDLSVDFAVTPSTGLTLYISGVRGGGVASQIYPLGGHAALAYLELTRSF